MPPHELLQACPSWLSAILDNWVRRRLHDPKAILSGHVKEGQTVLDIGCGPGVFTIPMAEMVGAGGIVIAADIQDGMLQRVREKAEASGLSERIRIHRSEPHRIGVTERVDFALAFYMVHEVADQSGFFGQLRSILRSGGRLLVVEPIIHVSRQGFDRTIRTAKEAGLRPLRDETVRFSMAKLLENP